MKNSSDKSTSLEYLPLNEVQESNRFSVTGILSKLPVMRPVVRIIYRLIMRMIEKPFRSLLLSGHVSYSYLSGRATYNMMGLLTNKNCDFMKDPEFLKGYAAGMRQYYIPHLGGWIVHVNQWAAFHAKQLEGDFVECGVYRGTLAMSNIIYIDFRSLTDRKYYLFDTFCGLDEEFSTREEYLRYKDVYPSCYEFVVDSFKEYPNVVIVKGPVPKTLSQVEIKKVAYLSIDMNCVEPEVEALKYFYSKLVPGGIIVLDDYGWPGHENQKRAVDNFALSVGVKLLYLPTGQGMIIKPL